MLQRPSYDKAVDIWALGVIVFVLLCGCLPFDDDSSRISNESAARKKFTLRFPRWASTLSVSAKDLLHNLLDVNPKTRYTAGDFFESIDNSDIIKNDNRDDSSQQFMDYLLKCGNTPYRLCPIW